MNSELQKNEFDSYNPLRDSQFYTAAITNLQMRQVLATNVKTDSSLAIKYDRNYVQDAEQKLKSLIDEQESFSSTNSIPSDNKDVYKVNARVLSVIAENIWFQKQYLEK